MKAETRSFVVASVVSAILLVGAWQPVQAQTIKLEGDVWAPYVMDPAGGSKGFMVDVAELALTRAGYKVSFAAVPWSRALLHTENGNNDGIVGIYFSQAKEKAFVVPAEEIGISVNHLFTKKDSTWTYEGIASLESMKLGVIADYDYGELNPYIEKLKKDKSRKIHVTSGNGVLQQHLNMLLVDRVTVVVEDPIVVSYVARKMGGDIANQIKSSGVVEPQNEVGIAFSPKSPKAAEYAKALSEGIQKLRKSGELKAILDKYYVKDWK